MSPGRGRAWRLVLSYLPGKAGADAAVQRGVARAKHKAGIEREVDEIAKKARRELGLPGEDQ